MTNEYAKGQVPLAKIQIRMIKLRLIKVRLLLGELRPSLVYVIGLEELHDK